MTARMVAASDLTRGDLLLHGLPWAEQTVTFVTDHQDGTLAVHLGRTVDDIGLAWIDMPADRQVHAIVIRDGTGQ